MARTCFSRLSKMGKLKVRATLKLACCSGKCTVCPLNITLSWLNKKDSNVRFLDNHSRHTIISWHFQNLLYLLEEGGFLHQKAQKKFWAPCENRTHDPPSSSSDSNHWRLYYTNYRGLYRGLTRNRPSTSVQDQDCKNTFWKDEKSYTRKLRKNSELQMRIELTTFWVFNLYENDINYIL